MLVNRNEQAQITKRTSDITLNDRNHTLFQVGRPNHRNVQPLLRPMIEPMYLQYTISTPQIHFHSLLLHSLLYYSHNARYRGFGAEKYKQPFK